MDGLERLGDAIASMWDAVVTLLPEVVIALLVLGVGLRVSRWIRSGVEAMLDRSWFRSAVTAFGLGRSFETVGQSPAVFVSSVIYGLLIVTVLLLASQVLGIDHVSSTVEGLLGVVPRVVAGALAVLLAGMFGRFITGLTEPWSRANGVTWLSPAIRISLMALAVLAAVEALGFGELNVRLVELGLLGSAIAGIIAFGVGGIPVARDWWSGRRSNGGGNTAGH